MKKALTIMLVALIALSSVFAQGANEAPAKQGSVYWLNFKPESDSVLQEVAKAYKAETGVDVKVVTAAAGTYNQTLMAEMDKSNPPTLFVVGNAGAVASWGDYCLDLKGTKIANELSTDAYNLYDENGKLCSIGYTYECFGIITNVELLEKAGYKLSDIKDFASLKAIAEDIHARSKTLGFDAFTSSGMDGSSSWRFTGHLANVALFYEARDNGWTAGPQPATITGKYVPNFKNLWDLYINNSAFNPNTLATGGYDAEAEFGKGQAVFYQNGNWEYDALTGKYGMDPAKLAMIPFYAGVPGEENAGLNCGTEGCWAINAKASQADIDATMDFMYWMVTSETGTKLLAQTFGAIPYKKAAPSNNVFLDQANEYNKQGKYVMTWAFNYTPAVDEFRAGLVSAMNQYDAAQTDANWKTVETAFVKGWERLYAQEH
ncbi:MAG: ABC transporter substrate-binding protein [Spirochaetales bacterium]|uniref:ABC transporter substrate-binding protein n=1 Tax=Bullifex sp. TaxID=2815808 RepID=UPI002A566275|nr:ABC transporter substrate-binding protein [Bullifex sp.]MDD5972579.1 ABC transporter substrate-binding protein [Spirochaetales bacterium]MDD7270747.1 ABC transporter substrate-binding protein [Spirochaetales bacterium]MDY4067819.1 ABC transporter substrate-binding protein [Bullifex sp.]